MRLLVLIRSVVVDPSEERLRKTAQELSAVTRNACLGIKADVRDPRQVQAAVKQTIERYGRIDFVINGIRRACFFNYPRPSDDLCLLGAAGNFLAPISGLSENGFRTVIEIDTVCPHLCVLFLRVDC
jgi:2,4-dienoyl-CoA reductase [(3E)-enoyl-CoA-producing], peroxisomal